LGAARRWPDRVGAAQRKIARFEPPRSAQRKKQPIMDVEHINAIGNALADLTKRTVDLRGYL
jgi:hypothetical protein